MRYGCYVIMIMFTCYYVIMWLYYHDVMMSCYYVFMLVSSQQDDHCKYHRNQLTKRQKRQINTLEISLFKGKPPLHYKIPTSNWPLTVLNYYLFTNSMNLKIAAPTPKLGNYCLITGVIVPLAFLLPRLAMQLQVSWECKLTS